MDAIYRFLEYIGYTVFFLLAVTLCLGLTGYVSKQSDASMQTRMEHKNVFTTEGNTQRPTISRIEAYNEIQETENVTVKIGGAVLSEDTIKKAKRFELTPADLGLTNERYKKSYVINSDGMITGIIYQ